MFIASSGQEPDASKALAYLAKSPYLNPSPQNKPYELPAGNPNIDIKERAGEIDSEDAMKVLTGLRTEVKGKEGVVRLMHTTAPDREMTFELKHWTQPSERRGSDMKDTSTYLRGLFSQALEGCDEIEKTAFLDDIDTYLKSRKNRFGSKSLVAFVEKLEKIKGRPGIVKQASGSPQLVGRPAERTYGKMLLNQEEVWPWRSGSMKKKSTLGEGGQGTAYLVTMPISESSPAVQVDRVVKVNTTTTFFPLTNGPWAAQAIMRRNDFAASRFKNERNIIRPEEYYIAVKENQAATNVTYWRVTARELKHFVHETAQRNPNAHIGIYATVMPLAKGEILEEVGSALFNSHSVYGAMRQVARGIYQAMTDLHGRGFAHNDLKPDNILFAKKTGVITLIDSGIMQKYSKSNPDFQQAVGVHGATPFMSPRIAQGQNHGPETDYYSFACLLLTTTEPEFESALTRIFAQEYPALTDEKKEKGASPRAILKNISPALYARQMIRETLADPKMDSEARDAALRLEQKLNNNPDFNKAVEDSFIASSGWGPEAVKARQDLAANPYLQSQN